MRSTSIVLTLVAAALIAACSSPAPETTYYLLRGDLVEGKGRVDTGVRVGLGRVAVAPYLRASPGIVIETAPGELRAAAWHQWAEPLDAGLRLFLRGEISRAFGHEVEGLTDRSGWDYRIEVYVRRLHGTMSGTALLEAAYVILSADDSKRLREYRFSKSEPLSAEGYAALVAAQRRLATELAESIAADLRSLEP